MATVVDELIVRLGLDPSDFEKGRKKAAAEMMKAREGAVRDSKAIEDAAKKSGAGIERVARNVIALFAAITGSRALSELVTGLTKANAEIGRFAANVALGPQTVAAWGMAVQRIGGDAGNAQASISKLSSTITNFRNGLGQMPQEFWFLRQRSGVNINPLGDTEEVLTGIAEAIKRLSATDRQSAFNFAQALGIDDKTFEVMRQHGAGVKDYLQSLEKYAPSNRAIQQATKLQEAWGKLVQTIGKVVQDIMEKVSPHLEKIVSSITAMVERLTNGVDWKAIDEGMATFAGAVKSASENMDGLTAAVGAFFALWTGAQFAKVLANMLLLRGGGVASVGAGGGAAASLTRSLPWLAALGTLIANKDAIGKANQDSIAWTEAYNRSKELVERGSPGPSTRGGRKRGIGTMGGMRYTTDPNAERLLHPSLMNDNLSIEGRPVGKGNPVPVVLANQGVREKGFFERIGDAVSSFFGGSAEASTGAGGGITPSSSDTQRAASGPTGVNYSATSIKEAMGLSDAEWNAFREGLTDIEGKHYGRMGGFKGRYAGRYQMGPKEITETAARLGVPRPSQQEFLSNPQLQEKFFENYTLDHHRTLMKSEKYRNMSTLEKLQMLGYSHNQGAGGGLKYLRTGIGGRDGWGFDARKYFGTIRRRYEQMAKAGAGASAFDRPNEARAWPGQDTGGLGNLLGAQGTALTSSISNDNRQSTTSSNVDTRIGHVNVFTQATDSKTIVDRLWDDLYNRIGQSSSAAAANTGPV